jgi:hypothetical protein
MPPKAQKSNRGDRETFNRVNRRCYLNPFARDASWRFFILALDKAMRLTGEGGRNLYEIDSRTARQGDREKTRK